MDMFSKTSAIGGKLRIYDQQPDTLLPILQARWTRLVTGRNLDQPCLGCSNSLAIDKTTDRLEYR
jgi:hypothetical protein